jgi:type II secretory pathway component PulF
MDDPTEPFTSNDPSDGAAAKVPPTSGARRGRSETWKVIERWRVPIVGTLFLALLEFLYLRFELGVASVVLGCLCVAPFLFYGLFRLARSVPLALACLFVMVAGAVALAQFVEPLPAVGIALLCALALASHAWKFKLRHLMVLLVLIAAGIRFGMAFGVSALLMAALLVPPLVLVGLFQWFFRSKNYEREALVQVLELAARSGLPLGAAAEAFAGLCSRRFRPHALELGRRLEQGEPLHEALQSDPAVATGETRLFARIGGKWSVLGPSLGDAVAAMEQRRSDPLSLMGTFGYPLIVLSLIGIGLFYLTTYLVPRIVAIIRDFGLGSGGFDTLFLEWFQQAARLIGSPSEEFYVWLVLSLIGAIVFVGIVVKILAFQGHPIPSLGGWLSRRRESAAALRGLALGIEQGRPLHDVLADLGRAAPSAWSRRKLRRAWLDVERGRPWTAALQARGLIGHQERAVLSAAERAGNLPWVARLMADALERRSVQRLRIVGMLIQPVVLSAIGALVLFAALTYFLPLISVLQRLAEEAQ